jgi:hypothetical protein
MFVAMLSTEQRRAFMVCAHRLIAADGIVVREERAALAALAVEMGSPRPGGAELEAFHELDESALATLFDSHRTRVAALIELLGLARSDHEFTLDEESFVTVMAHEMGLDAAELGRLDAWVVEHERQLAAAFELMQE